VKNYELLTIVKPTLTEEELTARVEFIKETLTKNGAEILFQENMGVRKLAYSVAKNDRGYYTVFYIAAPASSIAEVERVLRITEDVIKFLTIKFESKKEVTFFNKMVASRSTKAAPKAEEKRETTEETKAAE
jgi:small subunit ribosomal protein S6